ISAEAQSTIGREHLTILHPLGLEDTDDTNFTEIDQGAGSNAGGVGYLHVTGFDGSEVVIKIQDSDDNQTYADLIEFSTVDGIGAERKVVAGAVGQYVRARIEDDADFTDVTFQVAFGRF